MTPWTAACQAFLSITNSRSLLKLMSIALVMPSNHFILCCPLLLPPSIFPSIRVVSNESVLRIRWSKYWSFSVSISPSNEYLGLLSDGKPNIQTVKNFEWSPNLGYRFPQIWDTGSSEGEEEGGTNGVRIARDFSCISNVLGFFFFGGENRGVLFFFISFNLLLLNCDIGEDS